MFHFCLRHRCVEGCDLIQESGKVEQILCQECRTKSCSARKFSKPNKECVIVRCKQFDPDCNYPYYYSGYISLLNDYLQAGKMVCALT